MSKTLATSAVIDFDANVHHVYQGMALLDGSCRSRENVVGESIKFPVMGKGIARKRTAPQVKLELMNAAHSRVTCTLEDYNASDMTDIWDQAEVNFDEKNELAQVIAGGIGRREDQVRIDALKAAVVAGTVTNSVAATGFGATNNMNLERTIEASRLLNVAEVPQTGRHMLIHSNGLAAMLKITAVTSADYATFRALMTGEINTYLGFSWHIMGDRAGEGGLAVAASIRQCWAWHFNAIGFARGKLDRTMDISWLGDYGAWITSKFIKIGAVVIDGTGCVQILADET